MAKSFDEIELATLGRDAWARLNEAYQALQKSDSASSEQLDAAAFRAEMQRFQLWAINLGLYRQDHSSLDYCLRDNEVVRSFTEELLTSLIEALEEITSIIGHSDDQSISIDSEIHGLDVSGIEDEESLNSRHDEASLSSPIVMGILNDGNESMLTLHFEDMAKAIDHLYNLASQIRSPRTRKYRTDIDLYKDVDDDIKSEYVSMRQRAELQGIEEILLQSRKLLVQSQNEETSFVLTEEDKCLIERLQKANHARRQQFEYWRRSKKQSVRAASRAMRPMPVAIHNDDALRGDTPSLVQPSEVTRSVLSSVPALPKEFVLGHNRSTYTGTSRGLTLHGPSGEKVDWPKPPVAGPRGEDFECPFCFYLCGQKYSEDAAWRSHLKHDLRPCVCTYNECTEPNVLYDSWEAWTRHEQWAHQQRVWRCSEHPQPEHVDLASYEEHVKTYHAASMHHLLSPELLQSQESVSQVCDRPCPFCQREYERPIDLQHHVAGHLESTALLSLPNLDNVEEGSKAGQVNSNSANRNYADSRADDFDRMEPLHFSENYSEDLTFELIKLLNILSLVPLNIVKKSESGTLVDLSTELRLLQEKLHRLLEAHVSPQYLSDWQRSEISAIQRHCENLLKDMNKISVTYEDPKLTSGTNRTSDGAQTEIDLIRLRLTSISSKLSDLAASFPRQVKEGAVGIAEGLESSGQSRMRSILANLIALDLAASDSEGERLVDDQMTPASIPMSSSR